MAYEVLARKWRPQTFDDVVGQDTVVSTLKRALSTERVAHAFLFTGSRGIGKTTVARLMAKALCCEKGITDAPDGTCVHCREIAAGSAVDVVEIDGASHTGVDDIRDLREATRFQPQSCRFKVFIIDEVHMLSTSAFNALLKTLEEPPPHVKFIFATTEPHKIPVTILSRCQRYDFRRIKSDVITDRLKSVLAAEDLSVDDEGLRLIARAAEGGMRDALSLTDQVLSFAGSPATASMVRDALGMIDRRSIVELCDAILDRRGKDALSIVQAVYEGGFNLLELTDLLAREIRHLNVAKAAGSVVGFADLAEDDLAHIDARAAATDGRDLQRLFQAVLDGQERIFEAENERLALELLVIRLCQRPSPLDAQAVSEALVRLDALAKGRAVPPLGPRATSPAADIVRGAREQSASSSSSPAAPPAPEPEPALAAAAPPPKRDKPSPPPAAGIDAAPPPRAPAPPAKPAPKAAPPPAAPVSTEGPTGDVSMSGEGEPLDEADDDFPLPLEGIDETWLAFVQKVGRRAYRLGGDLAHGKYLGTRRDGDVPVVCVFIEKTVPREQVASHVKHPAIVEALSVFGPGARLEVTDAAPGDEGPSIAEAQDTAVRALQSALEAHAREHPIVQKALTLFGGEIRGVRQGADR